MADIRLSGYHVTTQTVTFSGTQQLNSLDNEDVTDLSDEIDNSSNGYMFADFWLDLAAATWDGTDATFDLFLVPTVDGSTYPDFDGNTTTPGMENYQYHVGTFIIRDNDASVTADSVLRGVELPPGKFKVALWNHANVATASSGNALKYRPWSYATV